MYCNVMYVLFLFYACDFFFLVLYKVPFTVETNPFVPYLESDIKG
jgi:hypothetical protein